MENEFKENNMPPELSEAARKARREYNRKYREEHKDQIEENRRRYWERVAQKKQEELHGKTCLPVQSDAQQRSPGSQKNTTMKDHIRRQLDIFRHELRFAEERGMVTEARIFRAQAAAYRMGLEEVLNAERVAEIFEGYDFGGGEA